VVLLDRDEIEPGQTAFAQIRLDEPVTLVRDDACVLRSYSPVRTIGGGKVINPIPFKHKRNRPDVIEQLAKLAEADPEELVQLQIAACGFKGCSHKHLRQAVNLADKPLDATLQALMSRQQVLLVDKEKRVYIHPSPLQTLQDRIRDQLGAYHKAHPLKEGMPKEELKSKLPAGLDNKLFTMILNLLGKSRDIVQQEDLIRLADHRVSMGVDQETLSRRIQEIYLKNGITPPYFKEVRTRLDASAEQVDQVLALLVDKGILVKVKEDFYYHREPLEDLKKKLVDYLVANEEISTPQVKDMTGASRKFVISLMEYFDNIQLTLRVGDVRKLRKRPTSNP
jgi:selenocysteine-specific elongation factor